MEELSDKDFDQIFKNKIKEGNLEYEEESWLKLEKKLRTRDRFVFFRNASIILLFLSVGIGIYVVSEKKEPVGKIKLAKRVEKLKSAKTNSIGDSIAKPERVDLNHLGLLKTVENKVIVKPRPAVDYAIVIDSAKKIAQYPVTFEDSLPRGVQKQQADELILTSSSNDINTPRKAKPITLSIHIGPDFNATNRVIGGKSGIALGLGISVPLSRTLSIQTGLNYGVKNYNAEGYDYAFNNPNTVYSIASIEAACKVVEIPLRIAYLIGGNHRNTFGVNAGLASYIMLKEKYRFIYTPQSGRKDRFLEERNTNQHYLSVIDLSATYNLKLKNKKFAVGIEPYLKIPLSGIGEGSVPLKSSGISLKLNYELNKKK